MKWRQSYEEWDEGSQRWKPYSGIYDTPFWPSRLRGDYSNISITPADDEAKAYQANIDEYVKLAKIYDTYAERPHEWLKEELRDIKNHYKTPEETKEFLEVLREFITPEMLRQDERDQKKKEIRKRLGAREVYWDDHPDVIDNITKALASYDSYNVDTAQNITDAVQGVM